MSWALPLNSAKYVIAIFVGIAIGIVGAPIWRFALINIYQEDYGELTYLCDSAMRDQYIARARVREDQNERAIDELRSSQIALIDCQDYDMMQKRLTLLGLRPNELSLMRLRSIEGRNGQLDEVVRIHEIRD